jgi:hypothetical protein
MYGPRKAGSAELLPNNGDPGRHPVVLEKSGYRKQHTVRDAEPDGVAENPLFREFRSGGWLFSDWDYFRMRSGERLKLEVALERND